MKSVIDFFAITAHTNFICPVRVGSFIYIEAPPKSGAYCVSGEIR